MKKELYKKIEIPNDVEVEIKGNTVKVKGPKGENSRKFKEGNLEIGKKEDQIVIGCKKATKKEKKMMNTISSHIKNMIKGVQKKFEYKLKVCFSHFPISIEAKGKEILIKNFLGEKVPRKTIIPNNVDIKIEKEMISVSSVDKELAGQAAANFETATRIRNRDKRIFQDGIYIINKAGKEI
jgi:large subunit ribosomal protein L6